MDIRREDPIDSKGQGRKGGKKGANRVRVRRLAFPLQV